MKNKKIGLMIGTAILVLIGVIALVSRNFTTKSSQVNAVVEESYYTCPMHPHIHSDKPGTCPICHMKLVQVKKTKGDSAQGSEKRSEVTGSKMQFELLGIQKTTVETMSLTMSIPISGRFLSNSTVAIQIYENDLRYVKVGLDFMAESSAYPEQEIKGKIQSIDTVVDPTSRTTRVVGRIENQIKEPLHEMSFSGSIKVQLKNKLFIPESSVLHAGKKDLVYIFQNESSVLPQEVKLGATAEGYYEVLSGLQEGETISSGPNFLIDSEARIRGVND